MVKKHTKLYCIWNPISIQSKKDLAKKLDKYIEHGVKEMVYVGPKNNKTVNLDIPVLEIFDF